MLNFITNNLPLTKIRIKGAKLLYKITKLILRNDHQLVTRKGVNYFLDLSEGIDFSIFLFGGFQKYIFNDYTTKLSSNPIIIDIGANIGHMSLILAKKIPNSTIYSFEPTDYAYNKLEKNISINPLLSSQIKPIKAFISKTTDEKNNIEAYSSWKINGARDRNELMHPIHLGTQKKSTKTPSYRFDDFINLNKITKIDLIKIDTDGHEFDILSNSLESIKKYKPLIIFEIGLYILKEKGQNFELFFDLFKDLDYTFTNLINGEIITKVNYLKQIPKYSTIDILVSIK